MAKMPNEIVLKVDNFIKDTRLSSCWVKKCRFNHFRFGEANCELKQIIINESGKCGRFEEIKPYVYSEDEINE